MLCACWWKLSVCVEGAGVLGDLHVWEMTGMYNIHHFNYRLQLVTTNIFLDRDSGKCKKT